MIVTDDSPPKGSTTTDAPPASQPPPPYQPHSYQQYNAPQPLTHTTPTPRRESAAERFFKAFAIALLICFLGGMLTSSTHGLARGSGGRNSWDGRFDGWPIPDGIHTDSCINGHQWSSTNADHSRAFYRFAAETSFELPLSSELLFLLSRGTLSAGDVQILPSSDVGENVKVTVVMKYNVPQALLRAKVCSLTRGDGERGVGIFTPRLWLPPRHPDDNIFFNVTVHLPVSSDDFPRFINNFETDLSNFSQVVGLLHGAIDFGSISLKSSNSAIKVESLHAVVGKFQTANGPITGTYNSSTSLTLRTSNAPVIVNVGLTNDDNKSTDLEIYTSNGPIKSSVSLLSPQSDGGTFRVTSETSNNLIDLNFPTSPVDSELHLNARSSNSPALVSLHSAYEGSFTLRTSNAGANVQRVTTEDPAGENRRRSWNLQRNGGGVQGSVIWEPSGRGRKNGHVQLVSSNSPVELNL